MIQRRSQNPILLSSTAHPEQHLPTIFQILFFHIELKSRGTFGTLDPGVLAKMGEISQQNRLQLHVCYRRMPLPCGTSRIGVFFLEEFGAEVG